MTDENTPSAEQYNQASKTVMEFILENGGIGAIVHLKTMMDYTQSIAYAHPAAPEAVAELHLTVWKDGTHTVWNRGDAFYARNDPDWLMEFPLSDAIAAERSRLIAKAEAYIRSGGFDCADDIAVAVVAHLNEKGK